MRGAVITLMLRRMASSWLLLCCVLVTTFVTAALLAALAGFESQALPQALHRRLAVSTASSITIIGVVGAGQASTDTRAIGTALHRALGPAAAQLDESVWSAPLALPGAAAGLGNADLAAPDQIRQHVALVAGTWPAPPRRGQPIPAAVPAAIAAALHSGPGALVTLRDLNTRKLIRLQISATYRQLDPAAPYWTIDQIWTCGAASRGCFTSQGPIVVSPAAFRPGELTVDQASWVALLDASRIPPGELGPLATRIGALQSRLQNSAGLGGLVVSTTMPQALLAAGRSLTAARSVLVMGSIPLVLVGAVALVLATSLLAGQRDREREVLAARGASRWRLLGAALAEALALAALAVLPAVPASGKLSAVLATRWLLSGAGLRLTGIAPMAWAAAALVFGLCVAAMLGPVLVPPSAQVSRLRRSGRTRPASAVRAGGDIALLALAILAVWQLRSYSPLTAGTLDPVLAVAPALALAAVSVIWLRLLPAAARLLDRAAARGRRAVAALASWEVGRRPLGQAGPVMLTVLAVATATLALSQYQSWRRSASDQAAYAVGSDVQVSSSAPVPASRVGAIADAAGVLAATPVVTGTNSADGQTLALDARTAPAAVLMRQDLSPVPVAELYRRITPHGPAPGLELPGQPARIRIAASLNASRGAVAEATVMISVQDRFGTVFSVPAGVLHADGHPHALVALLSATAQAGYPLRLLGLSLTYPLRPAAPGKASRHGSAGLVIRDMSLAGPGRSGFARPFAAGRQLARWRPAVAATGLGRRVPGAAPGQPPAVRGWHPAATGASQALAFAPGAAPAAPSGGVAAAGLAPAATVTLTAPIPARTVPGIATSAFLNTSGTAVGQTVPVSFGADTVPVTLVAAVAGFPTVTGPNGAVIVDLGAVQDVLASRWDPPPPTAAWWLSTADGVVPRNLPAGVVVRVRDRVAAQFVADPLAALPLQGLLGIAVAVALLASVGFAVSVAARLRAGRLEGALLTALGMSWAAQARRLCAEELMLAVPGAVAGLAAGAGVARLMIPALIPVQAAVLPVTVVLPVSWLLWMALAVIAIPVLAAATGAGTRADPAGQLRMVIAP